MGSEPEFSAHSTKLRCRETAKILQSPLPADCVEKLCNLKFASKFWNSIPSYHYWANCVCATELSREDVLQICFLFAANQHFQHNPPPFDSGVSSPPPDRRREEVKVNTAEPCTLLPVPSFDRRQCPHTRRERTQPLRRVRMRALVWARPTTMKDFIWHHDWLGHAAAQVAASLVCPINFLPSARKRPNLPYEHSTPVIGPGRGRRPEALKLRKPPEEGR